MILQSEAFSSGRSTPTPWSPDVFKEGGFANLQKNAALARERRREPDRQPLRHHLRRPERDPRPHAGRRARARSRPDNAWIGQNPDTGFLALAPWIVPDPGDRRSGAVARRRGDARSPPTGAKLLPGSGVAVRRLARRRRVRERLPRGDRAGPTSTCPTAPVTARRRSRARGAAALRGERARERRRSRRRSRSTRRASPPRPRVYVVWHEARRGLENVYLAVSARRRRDASARRVRVSDNAPGAVAELHPAVAVRGEPRRRRLAGVRRRPRRRRRPHQARALRRTRAQARRRRARRRRRPGAASGCRRSRSSARDPVVAWIDERDAGPEGEPLEHVYVARGRATAARASSRAVRVDAGAPVDLAAHLDNKWAPPLDRRRAARVYVAWADFRNYNWDIFLARSDDGGAPSGANVRVDDFPDLERINERPSLAVDRARPRARRLDRPPRARARHQRLLRAERRPRRHLRAEPAARRLARRLRPRPRHADEPVASRPRARRRRALRRLAGRPARQQRRLLRHRATTRGATFAAAERVDDTGAGASEQTRPEPGRRRASARAAAATWPGRTIATATRDIYLARRACGAP